MQGCLLIIGFVGRPGFLLGASWCCCGWWERAAADGRKLVWRRGKRPGPDITEV